jgi:hypothetical protein
VTIIGETKKHAGRIYNDNTLSLWKIMRRYSRMMPLVASILIDSNFDGFCQVYA